MKKLLSFCVFLFINSCALVSFAADFQDIPDATVIQTESLPDNTLVFMQGYLDQNSFKDSTGTIRVRNNFYSDKDQKIEILAQVHNDLLESEINIITLSPL